MHLKSDLKMVLEIWANKWRTFYHQNSMQIGIFYVVLAIHMQVADRVLAYGVIIKGRIWIKYNICLH